MNIQIAHRPNLDLMPSGFADGLEDWSFGDGTPASGSYAGAANAKLIQDDEDFGACLELRTMSAVQRLRYMAEVPIRAGHFIEVSARLKVVRGPLPLVRVSAFPGGHLGQHLAGLSETGPPIGLAAHGTVFEVSAVIGPETGSAHLVWSASVRYAHVGIDILGTAGAVVRVERVAVRDVTRRFLPLGPVLPGFEDL